MAVTHGGTAAPSVSLPCKLSPLPSHSRPASGTSDQLPHPLLCAVFLAKLNTSHRSAPLPAKANINPDFNHGNALHCPVKVSPGSAGHHEPLFRKVGSFASSWN